MKQDINNFLDIDLNNKFYLKISFKINNDKIANCIDIIKNIKMEGIVFTLPTKTVLTDDTCELSIMTKVGTKVVDMKIKNINDFINNIKVLDSVSEIVWAVYDNNDNKLFRYEYDAQLGTEEFEAN